MTRKKDGYEGDQQPADFVFQNFNGRGEKEMKKAVWVVFVIGIALMLCAPVMAKRENKGRPNPDDLVGSLDAPQNFRVVGPGDADGNGTADSICFAWDYEVSEGEEAPDKYSVDIEFVIESDVDDESDTTADFSFGTGDRTDGLDPSNPSLCVLLTELAHDLDGDGEDDQLYGEFSAKVKALNPGKGKGRQNHPFSEPISFLRTSPDGSTTME
jgi:hypothetical protein